MTMEKPSSRRWSSGGADDGHHQEETLPLRGGLETERAPHEQEAGRVTRPELSCHRNGNENTNLTRIWVQSS